MPSDVVVYHSGLLYEADMVAEALEAASIPYLRRMVTDGGVELPMPDDAAPIDGVFWLIRVPRALRADAERTLRDLPMIAGDRPGFWDPDAQPRLRMVFRLVAAVLILAFAATSLL